MKVSRLLVLSHSSKRNKKPWKPHFRAIFSPDSTRLFFFRDRASSLFLLYDYITIILLLLLQAKNHKKLMSQLWYPDGRTNEQCKFHRTLLLARVSNKNKRLKYAGDRSCLIPPLWKVFRWLNLKNATSAKNQLFREDDNSFVMEAVIIQKPVHWFALTINGLVSIW